MPETPCLSAILIGPPKAGKSTLGKLVAPYPNVFLLMPEPDPQASTRILLERLAVEVLIDDKIEVMERLVHHPAHFFLARAVIYTSGKTPEQTCEEIISLITE
jgi:hypothetical protein